ncbi:MAG: hypothetical protein L3J81_05250 [Thermoplasmata archaeon]|jgi:hypothetical protein|nr:hypothetical protein [Thermoplasmata archaeon]
MATKRKGKPTERRASPRRARTATKPAPKFVGRDASPVLERYPPKDSGIRSRAAVPVTRPPSVPAPSTAPGPSPTSRPGGAVPAPGSPPASGAPAPPATPKMLIALERPFDIDEFSQLLGETVVRTEVPREDLAEALRRISEFMSFGIYVYAVRVRPAPEELLKRFVVELQRVDYDPRAHDWTGFEETGRSDSPFGPTGGRR